MKEISEKTRKRREKLISEYGRRQIKCDDFCKINKVSRSSIYKWRKYFNDENLLGLGRQKSQNHLEKPRNQKENSFTTLRIESEVGNKTEAFCNKQEESLGKYKEQINKSQVGKITSPIRISKNCGLTIEFASVCSDIELNKIIEVMNVTK